MTTIGFLSFGFGEMLVLGLVALMVFGGRLPEVMRNLGRAYARFRQGMNDLSRPIRDEMRSLDVPRLPTPRLSPPTKPPVPQPDAEQLYVTSQTAEVADPSTPPTKAEPAPTRDPVAPRPTQSGDEGARRSSPHRSSGGAADEPPPV